MDKALLASLKSSLGVEATFRTEMRFPPSGLAYQVVVGCHLDLYHPDQQAKAVARMEGAQVGPTKQQAEDWLVMLEAACAGGRKGEISKTLQLEVYAGVLSRYPADVGKKACLNLALRTGQGSGWFPTLSDLNAECEKLAIPRRVVLNSLRRWNEPVPKNAYEAAIRDRLFKAKEMEDEAHLLKRSNPDRHAELVADVKSLRDEADMIRRGELQPWRT